MKMQASAQELIQYAWNASGTHLNAHPDFEVALDLASLPNEQGKALLMQLMQGGFRDIVTTGVDQEPRVRQVYFEGKAWERSRGGTAVGIGYPFFQAEDKSGRPIFAPLLIWEVHLEPGNKYNSPWRLSRTPTHRLRPNLYLLSYWKAQNGKDLSGIFDRFLDRQAFDLKHLQQLCTDVGAELSVEQIVLTGTPGIPPSQVPDAPERGEAFVESAILSFFPHQPPFTVGASQPAKAETDEAGYIFGPYVLDPFQATVAAELQASGRIWADGHSGTGKSALGVHLLVNQLANGKPCLVVSARTGILKEYETAIGQLGLSKLAFLLRDTAADKMLMLDILRAAVANREVRTSYDHRRWKQAVNKGQRLHTKLTESYRAYRRSTISGLPWAETIGQYLESARTEGKELLGTQLNTQDYTFDTATYEALAEVVERCHRLLEQTHTTRSPLGSLSPGLFLRMEEEEAKTFAATQVQQLQDKATRLQLWFINRLDAYADQLSAHYEQYYQKFARQLSQLKDQMAEQESAFGEAFYSAGAGTLRLKQVFSERAKALRQARKNILEDYETLKDDFQRQPYFDAEFPKWEEAEMPGLNQWLKAFETRLQHWRMNLREQVQDEVTRLSRKSVNPRLGFASQVEELEESLDRLLDDINETGLYHLPLSHNTLTLPKRQRFLEEVVEQLEETKGALPDFKNFYAWQRNWLQLDEYARRLIKALLKVKPNNWMAAFRTWFLDNALSQSYEAVLLPDLEAIDEYAKVVERLREDLAPHTLQLWQSRKEQAVQDLRRRRKIAHKWLMQGGAIEAPIQFARHLRTLGEVPMAVSPAILTVPHLAEELFSEGRQRFGLVIVEEAHLLSAALLERLSALGDRTLMLSPRGWDNDALQPEEIKEDVPAFQLRHAYKTSLHLRDAVRPGSAIPTKEQVSFIQVDGIYDEVSEQNDAEARTVLAMLTKIERTPQRTYPSVGIVCLTTGQRLLLADHLLGIKQRRSTGVEIIQQLDRNGLTLMDLSEIEGQKFDILILASTFGRVGPNGPVTGHVHRLDNPEAQQQIEALMCAARQKVWVVSSLPESWLEEGLKLFEFGQRLPACLAYWKACASSDVAGIEQLSARFATYFQQSVAFPPPFTLLRQVQQYLRPYLSPGRLHLTERPSEDQLSLTVDPAPGFSGKFGLTVDGFKAHTPYTSFAWEAQQRQYWKEQGYDLHQIWSPEWWRNPELQARKLASVLIQEESPPALGAAEEEE
ncbi:MAG: hypothetical protein RIC19_25360 [Phaeodactylibacter sp.]|uniref:hypothetical protein n=1 Tax=Phaeodactylibacter sp. TaxID=1940289 RepID=UPI0032EAC75E